VLQLFAVTGTNGKSSVTTSLAYAMARSGICSAAIGTLGLAIFPADCEKDFTPQWNTEITGGLTTPDAVDLQRILSLLKAQGVRAVAIEASSVGLLQGRLQGCMIKTAVFTNLSHDHLDLHGSMAAYAKAKALLFESQTLGAVVINTDDAYGMMMWDTVMARTDRIAVGLSLPQNADAGFAAINAHAELNGWAIQIEGRGKAAALSGMVHLPVAGRHNIDNALTVAACLFLLDLDAAEIHARLKEFHLPAGRLQMVSKAHSPWVCIDYAHSPDALARALEGLRLVAEQRGGRLICVFGCGGDRDTAKRPLMGEIAARLSDQVVLTSDNPRTESPEIILSDILGGVPPALADRVVQIMDRGQAITQTVIAAQTEDLILVAGKGHESFQQLRDRTIPFSDADHARAAIEQWLQHHHLTGQEESPKTTLSGVAGEYRA
jgi:UDP-N-acetylmuramyl-tripeptide synthetase